MTGAGVHVLHPPGPVGATGDSLYWCMLGGRIRFEFGRKWAVNLS